MLTPPIGQRVLILGYVCRGIFDALLEGQKGVQMDTGEHDDPPGAAPYDLVLEEVRIRGLRPRPRERRTLLVAPGGRWIAMLQGNPAVGFHGRAVLQQARREGFQRIETFYAHPSLASPQILVPLDRIEPIRYFLDFALEAPPVRKRFLRLGLSVLARLGIHREMLSNMILSARRGT
jgi:hypothetical protein